MLETGISLTLEKIVDESETAAKLGSGGVDVFSTPMMIALMEGTALKLSETGLEEPFTTVGFAVNIKHLKASHVGAKVRCEAVLKEVDGKKLTFSVDVYEGDVLVGTGTHVRYIINRETFMKK